MPWLLHTHPEENIMAAFIPTNEEVERFDLLAVGYYPFEILDVDTGLGKGKTSSNTALSLKLKFYADKELTKPVGQWTERLTLPLPPDECLSKESQDLNRFFQGSCNMFVKCAGVKFEMGKPIELDASTLVGCRGICHTGHKLKQNSPKDAPKTADYWFSYVDRWPTDQQKFPRNTPQEDKPPGMPF